MSVGKSSIKRASAATKKKAPIKKSVEETVVKDVVEAIEVEETVERETEEVKVTEETVKKEAVAEENAEYK